MDRFEVVTELLKITNEKEGKVLGDNFLESLIEDYYYARDSIEKYLKEAFIDFTSDQPITKETYEKYKKRISLGDSKLAQYFNMGIDFNSVKEIQFDDIINIETINKMYLPTQYGHGFGEEVIIPIVLTGIQTIVSIVAVIFSIKQTKLMQAQINDKGDDIKEEMDKIIGILANSKLTNYQKNNIISQLDGLIKLFIEYKRK
jgi:hypothetical protein